MDRRSGTIGGLRRLAGALAVMMCALPVLGQSPPKIMPSEEPARKLTLYRTRASSSDLAVTGMIAGLPEGATGYVHAADLAALPRVTKEIRGDEDIHEPRKGRGVIVTGVYLQVLASALGALPGSDLIDATCDDDYRGHYPASYVATHQPIVGFAIDHESPEQWAKQTHQYNPGPYFITHAHFVPAFRVLSHDDRPQVPTNVVRLNFSTIAATYGAVMPHGTFAQNSPQEEGFTIARQNCLRCHNQGQYGGTKAGRSWMTLSTWAREQPAYFENYIRNPKSSEPRAKMPGNPGYDRATLEAIAAYFSTFTEPAADAGR